MESGGNKHMNNDQVEIKPVKAVKAAPRKRKQVK